MHFRLFPFAVSVCALVAASCAEPTKDALGPIPLVTATPDEPSPDEAGTLEIRSDPSALVLVDGKRAGKTPILGYKVPPGDHYVTFVGDESGRRTIFVTVAPGEDKVVTADAAQSAERKP